MFFVGCRNGHCVLATALPRCIIIKLRSIPLRKCPRLKMQFYAMRNYLSKSCGKVERRQVIHQKFRVEITKPEDLSKSTHLEFDLLCNSGTRLCLNPCESRLRFQYNKSLCLQHSILVTFRGIFLQNRYKCIGSDQKRLFRVLRFRTVRQSH